MDLATLALHEPNTASDHVLIGDGTNLSIANTGFFTLTSLLIPLLFTNVLHVPTMSKNLISVFALCVDNPINVMLFYSFFQVQDCHTRVTLVHGQHRDSVYYWLKSVPLPSYALTPSSSVWSSFSTISIWHSRLGHPFLRIFHKFLNVLNISFPDNNLCSFLVPHAILIKDKSYLLQNQALPLPLLLMSFFYDVWTSPIFSFGGFNYYVIFVDHYTKYIWLYLLCHKSYVHSTFVVFKQLVENYFTTVIKTLYKDNGRKFLTLRSFVVTHGITHLTTPPHTPEHNGYSEHRH